MPFTVTSCDECWEYTTNENLQQSPQEEKKMKRSPINPNIGSKMEIDQAHSEKKPRNPCN